MGAQAIGVEYISAVEDSMCTCTCTCTVVIEPPAWREDSGKEPREQDGVGSSFKMQVLLPVGKSIITCTISRPSHIQGSSPITSTVGVRVPSKYTKG